MPGDATLYSSRGVSHSGSHASVRAGHGTQGHYWQRKPDLVTIDTCIRTGNAPWLMWSSMPGPRVLKSVFMFLCIYVCMHMCVYVNGWL